MVSRADDLRLRELLIERIGDEATTELLERLPLTPTENLATKDDLTGVRGEIAELRGEIAELRGEIRAVRAELKGEMAELRTELRSEMAGLRTELKGEMAQLRSDLGREMADGMRTQTWVFAGLQVSAIGVMAGVVALLTG
ncbi:MAG: hypothetical protein HYU28_12470 [Actinobacteria bacterium]|nr:hypothetical protein [Actinomycetota bacterium]